MSSISVPLILLTDARYDENADNGQPLPFVALLQQRQFQNKLSFHVISDITPGPHSTP